MPVLKGRRIAGRAYLVTVGAPIVPPTPNPSLTLVSIVGQTPGGTSSATLSFANGAPAGLTAIIDGGALSITGVSIRTISGLAETAAGTATFSFVTPSAGSHTIVVSGVGTYRADTPPYTLTTVAPPSPATLTITGITGTVPGGTSTASLLFANGAPATITVKLNGADLTISGAFINASGTGASASGNAGFSFVTPPAGSYTIVAHGTGTYLTDSNAYTLVTANVIQPPPGQGNSSATLTSQTVFDRFRVFNRDTYTGGAFGKGAGAVPVTVTPSVPVSALFMRLHDASDAAAQQNVPGSGTVLQASTAVAGVNSLTATANTVNLTVPGGVGWYYVDLALDGAMTHPIRVPIPFGVGAVFGIGPGTSHGAAFVTIWNYPNPPPSISAQVPISPYGVIYAPRNADNTGGTILANTWQKPGDYGFSPYPSTWGAEFLRLSVNQLGVNCALVGAVEYAGSSWDWVAPNPRPSSPYAYMKTAMSHAPKREGEMGLCGMNDAGPNITRGNSYRQLKAVYDDCRNTSGGVSNPATVVAASPLFDASAASDSWYIYHQVQRDLEQTCPNTVNDEWFDVGEGGGVGGHSSMSSRRRMAHHYWRLMMGLMGPAKGGFALRRGPRLQAGTRVGNVITMPVLHDGGTMIKRFYWSENGASETILDPATTTDSAISIMFVVYPAGRTANSGLKIPLATTSVELVNVSPGVSQVKLFLASTPPTDQFLSVYHGMDFPSASGAFTIITDDTTDGDNLGYGRPMPRTFEPVTIAPPSPAAQSIVIQAPPVSPVSGGWLLARGTGTGAPLETAARLFSDVIEVSINGGPYVVPEGLQLRNDNRWSGLVKMPFSIAPGTTVSVAARRKGQVSSDSTVSVLVVSPRTELPDADGSGRIRAGVVANYDMLNIGSLWQDAAKTVPASHLSPIRCWADGLGNATNDLKTAKTDAGNAPFYDYRKAINDVRNDPAGDRPCCMIGAFWGTDNIQQLLKADTADAAQSLIGDFTIIAATDQANGNWLSISNGSFQPWIHVTGGTPNWIRETPSSHASVICNGTSPPYRQDYQIIRYSDSAKSMTLQNRSTYNSTALTTVTSTNAAMVQATTLRQIWFGGTLDGSFGNGRFHQIIFINYRLSDAEVDAVSAWLQLKWPCNWQPTQPIP